MIVGCANVTVRTSDFLIVYETWKVRDYVIGFTTIQNPHGLRNRNQGAKDLPGSMVVAELCGVVLIPLFRFCLLIISMRRLYCLWLIIGFPFALPPSPFSSRLSSGVSMTISCNFLAFFVVVVELVVQWVIIQHVTSFCGESWVFYNGHNNCYSSSSCFLYN